MLIDKIEKLMLKTSKKTKTIQFGMNIPDLGINYSYSNTKNNQKFHSASVGKLMTSTLIFKLIDSGMLKIDTKIYSILKPEVLDGLYIYDGVNYQNEVTIEQLLAHTSGINDYFESKAFDGSSFTNKVVKNSDTFWTPADLLNYTKNNQKAVGKPGSTFFYSDTGYILLGMIIEAVYGMPFHQALETYIFNPAGMSDSTLCFYGEKFDSRDLAPLYINDVDVHLFKSLSCDFSGGGISTTTTDLLRFLNYLHDGQFFKKELLEKMVGFDHRYRQGLYYGVGMMQTRFEEFFFLLKNMPRLQGHLGVTGVHAWYDPISKGTYALNVGNTKDMAKSFKLLILILQLVQKERNAYKKYIRKTSD